MRGGLGGPTRPQGGQLTTPGPLWARAALRLSRAESARPPVVCLCPACPGWPAARGSVPSGWRPSRAPVLLNKAASRKLEWPLKRDRPREPGQQEAVLFIERSPWGLSGLRPPAGPRPGRSTPRAVSGRAEGAGAEGARGVVSWMRAEPGGSGTSDGGRRPAAGAPGPRTQAGHRKTPALSPGTVSTPPPAPGGRDRRSGAQGTHGGAGRPGAAAGRRASRAPHQGFGLLPGTVFCPRFPTPGQGGMVGGPGASHSGPEGRSQLQEGSSLASPALRPPHGLERGDGQSPSAHPGQGSLPGAPRPPLRERETLGRAHFTAQSTETPEAPCVVGGAPIPWGTHARGTRRLRQGGRGRPQAPGPGFPVHP